MATPRTWRASSGPLTPPTASPAYDRWIPESRPKRSRQGSEVLVGMIPIGDDNSDRRITPIVNYLLIVANIVVFVLLQGMGGNDRFTYAFSTVPQEIVSGKDVVTRSHTVTDPASGQTFEQPGLGHTPLSVYLTLLVSMFMHGGIAHIA